MVFDAALIKEQGVTFAVVKVKQSAVINQSTIADTQKHFARFFPPNIPIVLMTQDYKGTPTYYGRKDIVNFLAKIHHSRIPWKRYSV